MGDRDQPYIHPETLKMAEYIRSIIIAGSVRPVDVEFTSPIQCRKRHHNCRCKGKIRITPEHDVIRYSCTDCEVSGTISGWRGGDSDLSEFAAGSRATDNLVLHISEDDYKVLRKVLTFTGEADAIVAGAVWAGSDVLLTGQQEDWDELMGSVAFDARHSRPSKRRKVMDSICEKIERLVADG